MKIELENRIGAVVTNYNKALSGFAGILSEDEINQADEEEITKSDIVTIHQKLCKIYGGEPTIRDKDLLDNACVQPFQAVFDTDLYPTVYEKAAKFLDSFTHYQIFADGNKRTGFATMCVYLGMHNIEFRMSNKEAYNFVMDVIQGKYKDNSEIAGVIKKHCVPMDQSKVEGIGNMENIDL